MHEIILCKLGEVVLKGLNRHSFEAKLMSNIRRRTNRFGRFKIYSRQSTIYVEPLEDTCDLDGAYAACKQVFGIIAIARAMPCEKSKEAIFENARAYLGPALTAAKSFKVETRRSDKTFPLGSIQLSQWVGGALHDAFPHLKVDVHNPELTVHVEVREDAAYVHAPSESAAGGLPIGMGGHAVSLLSGGIDSPVSSYMIAKRGVQLEMIHFASPPYTSQMAREKVLQLARELTPWTGRLPVFIIPFTEIQEEIRRSCPEDHFTLIMRRFMMRLADMLAKELRCKALVTGECLGQVASQTIDALRVSEDVTDLPVLRPLIGMDKEEIVRMARRIGTFDTSILPYEDCCTVFTPPHPKTKPNVEEVREMEAVLDVEGLCARAMAGREFIRVHY
jgi:thiamine biosynthesis protein ThiI